MTKRVRLKGVASTVLTQLRAAIATGALKAPISRASLAGFGIRHQLDEIGSALGGHKSAACHAVLDVVLTERDERKPSPELVWTGPEAQAGTARDTAVVLRELFEGARESVILGGYSFKYARQLLTPLHTSMTAHAVDARFFMHVPQIEPGEATAGYIDRHLGGFFVESWPKNGPRPHVYYDKRAAQTRPPYSSLHAKCVVVDGLKAFVLSANFTQRAGDRNSKLAS